MKEQKLKEINKFKKNIKNIYYSLIELKNKETKEVLHIPLPVLLKVAWNIELLEFKNIKKRGKDFFFNCLNCNKKKSYFKVGFCKKCEENLFEDEKINIIENYNNINENRENEKNKKKDFLLDYYNENGYFPEEWEVILIL